MTNATCLYAVLGRKDDAIEALEQSVNKGWGDKAWLEHDSDLALLREEPRYLALIAAM